MNTLLIRRFSTAAKKESLVIIGTGWAGFKLLKAVDHRKYDITVISPRNHFVFTPLLTGTAVGTLEFRCVTEPVRSLGTDFKYYEAFAKAIDINQKTLQCENKINKDIFNVAYDKLIISCGAQTNTFNTPGVTEHALFLKEVQDARKIRNKILDCFELAAEPEIDDEKKRAILHFAVVGGGPTGVELSSEIHDFIKKDIHRLYPQLYPFVTLTVYNSREVILNSFDKKLSDYAMKKFAKDNIEVRTSVRVKEVKEDGIILSDGSEVKAGLVIWAAGLMPNEFIKGLSFPKTKSSRLLTDDYLRVLQENEEPYQDIYALGDCAAIKENTLPQTAQVAEQEANYLAKSLNASAGSSVGFKYKYRGTMAYIGDWKGVIDPPGPWKESGYLAWLIWRSAYFTMTVSLKNKILIPTYWFVTWIFGRDTSRF